MDVIILAFKLSVITRKMFNFNEMCLFEGHKSATTVAGSWKGRARIGQVVVVTYMKRRMEKILRVSIFTRSDPKLLDTQSVLYQYRRTMYLKCIRPRPDSSL